VEVCIFLGLHLAIPLFLRKLCSFLSRFYICDQSLEIMALLISVFMTVLISALIAVLITVLTTALIPVSFFLSTVKAVLDSKNYNHQAKFKL
jgi:hypothetical protein